MEEDVTHVHNRTLLSHKKTKTSLLVTAWMDREGVMPSAISRTHPAILRACVLGSLGGILEEKRRPLVGMGLVHAVLFGHCPLQVAPGGRAQLWRGEKGLRGTPGGLRCIGGSHPCFVLVAFVTGWEGMWGAEMDLPRVHEPACFPQATHWW